MKFSALTLGFPDSNLGKLRLPGKLSEEYARYGFTWLNRIFVIEAYFLILNLARDSIKS